MNSDRDESADPIEAGPSASAYADLFRNLSDSNRKLEENLFEFVRLGYFGGARGSKVFSELVEKLTEESPQPPQFVKTALDEFVIEVAKFQNCPTKADVNRIQGLAQKARDESIERAARIRDYNHFSGDALFEQHGLFPVMGMVSCFRSITSALTKIYLGIESAEPDSDIIQLTVFGSGATEKLWQGLRHSKSELVAYQRLLLLFETIFHATVRTAAESSQTQLARRLWEALAVLLENKQIHLVYTEERPLRVETPLEARKTVDRITRLKIFCSRLGAIYEFRFDLAHLGEEFPHLNIHSAQVGDSSFTDHDPVPLGEEFSNTELDDECKSLFDKIKNAVLLFDFNGTVLARQDRNERDETILRYISLRILIQIARSRITIADPGYKDLLDVAIPIIGLSSALSAEEEEMAAQDKEYLLDHLVSSMEHTLSQLTQKAG